MMDHNHARELLHLGKHLPQDKRQPLEAHLLGCPACREYAGFLVQLEHDLPASLPGVAFSQAELGRAASIISSRTRRGTMRKNSFDGVKFAAWGAAAVVLVLVLSWGIQNLMPQQYLPVGMGDQTDTPYPVEEPAQTTLPYTEPVSTYTPTPTEGALYPTAHELSLAAADLGAGWQLDAEVTDLDERYFMERGEDGRAMIWTEKKGQPVWFNPESIETISMRGFSQPEEKLVLFQMVAVFDDNAQLDIELQEKVPVCDPPCEHRNEYSDGSGDISYYRDISFGDVSIAGIVTDIADPHPPFISFIFFRKDRVLVTLFSVAKPDDPVNAPPVGEVQLEQYARIIEANIASAFKPSPQEIIETIPTLSAQEIVLNTADLGEGWTLDAEISDYNTNYKFDRREDGKAVIEMIKNHPEPRIHSDLVDSVSWRAFSQREQNYVLGQLVIVFKDAVLAEEAIKRDMPDCTLPCEHVTDYGDSGTREIYEDIGIGDESVLTRFFALEFDSQPVMNILQFRKGEVVVFLQSLPQMISEDNWEVGIVSDSVISGELLTELSRIIEARIPSYSVSPEAPESSPTPRPDPQASRLQPSLSGELLSLSGWSPDGQCLVYWTPELPDPGATGFIELVYRLGFYNPDSGQKCLYDEITTTHYARMVDWHPNERWGFQQDERFMAALPCEDPVPTDPNGFLTIDMPDLSVSPDGRYQAVTIRTAEGRVQYLETSLIDLETGEAVELLHNGRSYTGLPWRIDLPVLDENFLGGEWLTNKVFLINHSYDQGPLLLSPGKQVVQVSPELFDEPPGYQVAEGYSRRASGSPHPDGENFHLLMGTSGRDIEHLYLKLYHSETGEMEELPYRRAIAGGFFQDYLFLYPYPRETFYGYEHGGGIWVRPIDPPGSAGSVLATNMDHFQVSPDLDRLVYSHDQNRITLISFPDGEIIHSWETHGYGPGWFYWSPDGSRIATSGQLQGSQEVGIFVVEVE